MLEVQPHEVHAELAVELHERRAVRRVEHADGDAVVLDALTQLVPGR
ncbi:hypothetical protein [Halobacterium sp. CBA1126]